MLTTIIPPPRGVGGDGDLPHLIPPSHSHIDDLPSPHHLNDAQRAIKTSEVFLLLLLVIPVISSHQDRSFLPRINYLLTLFRSTLLLTRCYNLRMKILHVLVLTITPRIYLID